MPKSTQTLAPRQARFVAEYLISLDATAAARRAGYSAKSARQQGCNLLSHEGVAAAIAAARAKLAGKLEISAESVVAELAKIGFANMSDYMKVDGDGVPRLDFGALSRDQTAALAEVTVEEFTAGAVAERPLLEEQAHGGALKRLGSREVRRVKFRLHPKVDALRDLGKHLGIFIDRHEIDTNVKIISDRPMTVDEWESQYAR